MKKMVAILLTLVLVLGMTSVAFANGKEAKEKTVEVALSIASEQEFVVIYIDDEIELEAITPKHGSSYVDGWVVLDEEGEEVDVEVEFETVLAYVEGINSYVSTAVFVAEEVGTYTLKYTITMAAGKSHVRFVGEAESEEIEVREEEDEEEATIIGAEIRSITWVTEYKKDGSIQNIKGRGTVWAVYSDGDKVATTQTVDITFGGGEVSNGTMTKEVTVRLNGIDYSVNVTRP